MDYVPKECFIDFRDFNNYVELYKFIKNMSDIEYLKYLTNIEQYLKSEQSFEFQGKGSAQKIAFVLFRKKEELYE